MMNPTDIILNERSQMQGEHTAWFYLYQDQEQKKVIMVTEVRIMVTIGEAIAEDEALGSLLGC